VVAVSSRTFASAQSFAGRIQGCEACESHQDVVDKCDLIFITTSDDAIKGVASGLNWRTGQGVAHCSGATSLDVFDHPVSQGVIPGAFHPIQAFSSVENGVRIIPGTTFGIEGGEQMREALRDLALAIGGNPIFVKAEDKALYHLSAVMMGNLLTCLAATSAQLWDQMGYTRADGVKALVPMMRGVANNLDISGVPAAVAGPYVRGDMGTIRKHLETLTSRAPDVLPLYCELALAAIPFAVEKKALSDKQANDIRALVNEFKKKSGA
jgi:predicted short-subunit dehydrogenase-like oxidoreductase (DUF2520 family)